ncbi:HK97-gp10 family putative phage morphogenesis protein [Alicyclobacillus shizuokensis]|uniref:HK97-gp10 family putative phage morphogenesis protein n=1 Tax=Alicyclobacillus shizuokensis TaxID=392014 RepID=UPI00082F6EF3|nr:HK97-gp10 family putative phage morphogenesis protein [Alicyclobacillus shizuokensis]
MGTDLRLDGMDSLMARLNALGQAANKVANQALNEAAEPLAEAMRNNVHVSTVEHQHIRDDIQTSRVKTSGTMRYVEVGPGKETAWRAKFLEFGHATVDGGQVPAYPFVEPAIREARDEVFERLAESLRRGLGL